MKNPPKGKRRNAPAPYSKYKKAPFRYSTKYHDWRNSVLRTATREHSK
jgi:hypothetical protein